LQQPPGRSDVLAIALLRAQGDLFSAPRMPWTWICFILLILALLALDLFVLHRKAHIVGVKEALGWSAFWISLGLLFSVFVYFGYQHHWLGLGLTHDGQIKVDPVDHVKLEGHKAAVKFLTATSSRRA
jgi:tellurite resistance protein TerC